MGEEEDRGIIDKFDYETININDSYFFRNNCEIKVLNQNFILVK